MDDRRHAPCPLCGGTDADLVWTVPYTDIIAAMETSLGRQLPEDMARHFASPVEADLFRCRSCGLEHFAPPNVDDGRLYQLIDRAGLYEPDRWEFDRALALLHDGDAVLDVGCGDGAFLRRAAPRAGRVVGIDQNPDSPAALARHGIECHLGSVQTFATGHAREFNLVTLFQVIEHVEHVVPFVEAAVACARPGGTVLVSVPNAARLRIGGLDWYDCPPHHATRWYEAQLRALAGLTALTFVGVEAQHRPLGAVLAAAPRVAQRMLRRRGGDTSVATTHGAPSASTAPRWRRLRLDHTMMAIYRK